jgi:DNA-directed RNA polymerase subunit H
MKKKPLKKKPARKAVKVVKKAAPKRSTKKTPAKPLIIKDHALVPKHEKLNEKEKKELLEKYHISLSELPKMSSKDPAIFNLNAKENDIIRISRKSLTAGETKFYRGILNE